MSQDRQQTSDEWEELLRRRGLGLTQEQRNYWRDCPSCKILRALLEEVERETLEARRK